MRKYFIYSAIIKNLNTLCIRYFVGLSFKKRKKSNFYDFCYKVLFSFFRAKVKKIGYFMLFSKVYFVIFVYLEKESVPKHPVTILLPTNRNVLSKTVNAQDTKE